MVSRLVTRADSVARSRIRRADPDSAGRVPRDLPNCGSLVARLERSSSGRQVTARSDRRCAEPWLGTTAGIGLRLSAMAYTSLLDRLGLHRRELRAWALYDVANSAFMTTVLQCLPGLLRAGRRRPASPPDVARSRFAFATSLAGDPGRPARPPARRDRRLPGQQEGASSAAFLALGAAATAALYFVAEGQWALRPRDVRGRQRRASPPPSPSTTRCCPGSRRRTRWTASRPPASPSATSAAALLLALNLAG